MANYYVDYSATNDGNGTTAAQAGSPGSTGAYNTLAGKTFTDLDLVWIRRVSTSNISAMLTISTNAVRYIGWPMSGDYYYATRPASGTSNGWDSDVATQVIVNSNSTSNYLTISGNYNKFYRIECRNSANGGRALDLTGASNLFYQCKFRCSSSASASGTKYVLISGESNSFISCEFRGALSTGSTTSYAVILELNISDYGVYQDCTVTADNFTASSSGVTYALRLNDSRNNQFRNLTIVITAGIGAGTDAALIYLVTSHGNRFYGVNLSILTTFAKSLLYMNSANQNYLFDINGASAPFDKVIHLTAATGNFIQCQGITQPTVGTYFVYLEDSVLINNEVHLDDCVLSNSIIDVYFGVTAGNLAVVRNRVFAENTKFSCYPISNIGNSSGENVISSVDHNGQAGMWISNQPAGNLFASNVVRTDGASYSVKMAPLQPSVEDVLAFGLYDSEQIWIDLTAGSRTITLYGVHRGWNPADLPRKSDIWFETQAGGDNTAATSFEDAELESDSSSWSNETGLTPFKISLTVTAANDCTVPLRVYLHKRYGDACVFIDPNIGVA